VSRTGLARWAEASCRPRRYGSFTGLFLFCLVRGRRPLATPNPADVRGRWLGPAVP